MSSSGSSDDPLSAARGVVNAVLVSLVLWALVLGFAALIYFNVHV